MEKIDNIKNKYNELIEKYNELTLEEEKANDEHSSLLDEYEMSKRAYSDVCDVYTKINNRLSERKRKYVSKKHSRHINSVMLITLVCALSCASIYSAFGFVTDKFLLYWGSAILAPIAGMIDIKFFWDKLRKKYTDEFENLDSTIETKDTLDRMYAQKLRNEKDKNDCYDRVSEHAKVKKSITEQKNKVQAEINNLKNSFFDENIHEETEDVSLSLKK